MESYENFINELQKNIFELTGIPITDMCFAKKGAPKATKGDRLLITIEKHSDSVEIFGIHIREVFEAYQSGISMQKIMKKLSAEISKMKSMNIYESSMSMRDYEKIKSQLFIRLVNADTYSKKLSDSIYRQVGDIALALYFKVADTTENVVSTIVHREVLDYWQLNEDEVFNAALLNTYFMTPPRIFLFEKLITNLNYDGENFMDLNRQHALNTDHFGNCLSTTIRTNGAVAVFLPGVTDRIAELMNSDFYAVFTSVHEVMIHCARTASVDELKSILADTIENSTPPEDVLTHKIYKYNRGTKQFRCVSN